MIIERRRQTGYPPSAVGTETQVRTLASLQGRLACAGLSTIIGHATCVDPEQSWGTAVYRFEFSCIHGCLKLQHTLQVLIVESRSILCCLFFKNSENKRSNWELNSHTSVMVSSDNCNKNVMMSIQVSVCFYSGIACMGMYLLV